MSHERLPTAREIGAVFDGMASEYDDITDLWYSWLLTRIHQLLLQTVADYSVTASSCSLDVGCGTGFQTVLLALCGHRTYGLDVSQRLLRVATSKAAASYSSSPLLIPRFAFVKSRTQQIIDRAAELRKTRPIAEPIYVAGTATDLPFGAQSFDLVNCSGSTLNFVEDYRGALSQIVRVLKPQGVLFLEVENRFNLDLFWALLDSLTGGHLGYDQSTTEAWANVAADRASHVKIDYPFSDKFGTTHLPMRLFALRTLEAELRDIGLEVLRIDAVHATTNLLPSTLLDSPSPGALLTCCMSILARLDALLGHMPLIRSFGCSAVIVARRSSK